jgi:hypothetical protein
MVRHKYQAYGGTSTVFVVTNPLKPELNPSAQRCLTIFLMGILLLEPCISLIYG